MDKSVRKPKTINVELIYYMFDEIKAELKEMKKEYVTKIESQALKHEISELRREVDEIRHQRNLWNWLSPTLSAVITAIVTYVFIEYLRRV